MTHKARTQSGHSDSRDGGTAG